MSKFIVIEGIDGVGKTTLLSSLKLSYSSFQAKFFQEPTHNSPYCQDIQKLLYPQNFEKNPSNAQSLLDLFIKDRIWNIQNNIRPALEKNFIVIQDRYYLSTITYQSKNLQEIKELINMFTENKKFIQPDLILYLQANPKSIIKRIQTRNHKKKSDNSYFEKIDRLETIYNYYEYIYKNNFFKNIKIIDALQTPQKVLKEVQTIIKDSKKFT